MWRPTARRPRGDLLSDSILLPPEISSGSASDFSLTNPNKSRGSLLFDSREPVPLPPLKWCLGGEGGKARLPGRHFPGRFRTHPSAAGGGAEKNAAAEARSLRCVLRRAVFPRNGRGVAQHAA